MLTISKVHRIFRIIVEYSNIHKILHPMSNCSSQGKVDNGVAENQLLRITGIRITNAK